MRFMVMVKATAQSEAGHMPSEKLLSDMGKFNEELVRAGVMLAGEGLQPTSKGAARVRFSGSKRIVTDGPFSETKEVIGGTYLIECASIDEAVGWAMKMPHLATLNTPVSRSALFGSELAIATARLPV